MKTKIKSCINERLQKSVDISTALEDLQRMLEPYDIQGHVVILPDFTKLNTLPNGTIVQLCEGKLLNPALIGRDIGCGYNFFSVDINPKLFLKNGNIRRSRLDSLVTAIDEQVTDGSDGTIGRGNHFIDLYLIDEIHDQQILDAHGINANQVYFLVHSGSRQFGHQVFQEFLDRFKRSDQEPSAFNKDYISAFNKAREYAIENRRALQRKVGDILNDLFDSNSQVTEILDSPHNDIEVTQNNGQIIYKIKKGSQSLSEGQLAIIPTTAVGPAYIVKGLQGLKTTYDTINHGLGRCKTRSDLSARIRRSEMGTVFGNVVLNVSPQLMIEEHPKGYKDVEAVMSSVEDYALAEKVAVLRPVAVIVDRNHRRRK